MLSVFREMLVNWFCDNLPQSVYKLTKSRSRENTEFYLGGFAKSNFSFGGSINHDHNI